jgi:hypothetical protein
VARQPVAAQAAYVWQRYRQTAAAWLTDLELEERILSGTLAGAPMSAGAGPHLVYLSMYVCMRTQWSILWTLGR